jgi:hypothetical protein
LGELKKEEENKQVNKLYNPTKDENFKVLNHAPRRLCSEFVSSQGFPCAPTLFPSSIFFFVVAVGNDIGKYL